MAGDHLALHAEGERVHVLWTSVPPGDDAEIYGATITDFPTSIAVPRFEASALADRVRLRWEVGDTRTFERFRIHRAAGEGQAFTMAGEVVAGGARAYQWDDLAVTSGSRYRYQLEVLRGNHPTLWEGPIEVAVPRIDRPLRWHGATPNPFADRVEMHLEAPAGRPVRVRVYDVLGHYVTELKALPGDEARRVVWDGRDARGRRVAPGVFLIRAESGTQSITQRIARMR